MPAVVKSLIIVFIAQAYSSVYARQKLYFYPFDPHHYDPRALCNDGSRGGYYYANASSLVHASTFVIYFPGGGQCYDEQTCTTRSKYHSSSVGAPSMIEVEGLLDSDPSVTPLWGANKAYLFYCSSDTYMGDVGASKDTWNLHFRGQVLVESFIAALLRDHDLHTATKIYLCGHSAGARGMMTWIDKLVSSFLPPEAEVIGFLDSPYFLDVVSYASSFPGFPFIEQQKYMLFNTTGVISDDCASTYPNNPWMCQLGQHRMPFVKTSFFMVASQFDAYQLYFLTGASSVGPYEDLASYLEKFSGGSSKLYQYINNFAAYDLNSAEALRSSLLSSSANSSAKYGIMNTGCLNHGISPYNLFNKTLSASCKADHFLSINEAFSHYLSEFSRSRASRNSWVMTWTNGCHDIDHAIQCVPRDCAIASSSVNIKGKSLWVGYVIIIVSVGSILLVLAICYLIYYRSYVKKPVAGEGIDVTHDEQFHLL